MVYRTLGKTGIKLSAIGLGCMSMNHAYGRPDDDESIATLELALETGINFWDTADIYANGKNEELISKVLVPNRNRIIIATKFGFRPYDNGRYTGFDGSPAYMKTAVEKSLKRLKTETIDLYYAHRIDPVIPVEEMVGAMSELVSQGKIRFIGLSEASPATIRKAHGVHPISALQSEYSILTREPETAIIPLCRELGITFVPFSPLARGLVTNRLNTSELEEKDFRKTLPRYQPAHRENNKKLAEGMAALAAARNCTAAQLALAWVLSQGENIVPIPGTKKRKYLLENAAATDLVVSAADKLAIDRLLAAFPHTGNRYNEENLKFVDN
jgi:aryl-alcohol dehydrogenase-like predicted oxidoreductase